MSKGVTLGGDRLGSGNRLKQYLENYGRSNHNLSAARITSMAPGVLYPIYVNVGLTGDTFDFDINAFMRTLPTEGPMFGAFKLQVDVFSADIRLYQAILHNNTTEIGFDMDKVLLPKINLSGYAGNKNRQGAFSKSSLMYYLGMSGIGRKYGNAGGQVTRKIQCVPVLAYYDIFKNYYANKQEENAYVITSGISVDEQSYKSTFEAFEEITATQVIDEDLPNNILVNFLQDGEFKIQGTNLFVNGERNFDILQNGLPLNINTAQQFSFVNQSNNITTILYTGETSITVSFRTKTQTFYVTSETEGIRLEPFALKNIDNMRKRLLTKWDLNEEVVIGGENGVTEVLPYQALVGTYTNSNNIQYSKNCNALQGLVVKTYQSDMFNNWLENSYVDLVTRKSQVQVTNGSFSIDALNFAKKMYDHYNRIAITGGTYDGWQLATYGIENFGKCEKPIYHGGMSSEVLFDEVISSVVGNQNGEVQPLGTLGGRGRLNGNRGGKVVVKCREECIIMVMASLTPRVTYSQGNAWYLTELNSLDDLHKPEFDRIGFQDLMVENMAWWDTQINGTQLIRSSLGKQPAWIHYMTDIDKCFGDFAEEDGKGFMVLQRLYDIDNNGNVADLTSYIDPTKYNYAFAVRSLTAQNFWGFFDFKVKARRIMSAKQIPNV